MQSEILNDQGSLTVDQLLEEIENLFRDRFAEDLWLVGDVTSATVSAAGHCYFNLSNGNKAIDTVIFRGSLARSITPEPGMRIEALGRPTLYQPRGKLQFLASKLRPAGQGGLYQEYLRKKKHYRELGYFDIAKKQELVVYPRKIGIIASYSGAAVRDVLRVYMRKWPIVPCVLFDAPAQGEQAAQLIAGALTQANSMDEHERPDVLLLIRGGGSFEDFAAYQDDRVIEAIYRSQIPVVSGIGHESDESLSDLVADCHCPTPTYAMGRALPDRGEMWQSLDEYKVRLGRILYRQINDAEQKVGRLQSRLRQLANISLERKEQRLHRVQLSIRGFAQRKISYLPRFASLQKSLARQTRIIVQRRQERLMQLEQSIAKNMQAKIRSSYQQLENMNSLLVAYNPKNVLKRGFAIVSDPEKSKIISSRKQVAKDATLQVEWHDGTVPMQVQTQE